METYFVVRRGGWRDAVELSDATARSIEESKRMSDGVAWIRSYVLEERDGRFGTVCIYRAANPEAIRRHASAASIPVDEIVKVVDTVVVRPDPAAAAA